MFYIKTLNPHSSINENLTKTKKNCQPPMTSSLRGFICAVGTSFP